MNVEAVVEKCYRSLWTDQRRTAPLDPGRRLIEADGLSSLQLVMLVTTVCDETGLALTVLTDQDLAKMKTLGDIAMVVNAALQREGAQP